MTRRLRALAIALLAGLALGAACTAPASAEDFLIYSELEETTLTGSQVGEDVLTTTAGTVKCTEVTYAGSMPEGEAVAVEVTPTYTGCTAFGFAGATIAMNGCKYRFNLVTLEGSNYEGTTDIVCPEGKEIAVVAKLFGTTKCTVSVPAQSGLGPVTFTNSGSGTTREVTGDVSIGNEISYSEKAGTGIGACSNGSASNGSYAGTDLLTGEAEGAHVGIEVGQGKGLTELVEVVPKFQLSFEGDALNQVTNVTFENTGIAVMEVGSRVITPNEADFKVTGGTCGGKLNGGEKCTVAVKFVSGKAGVTQRFLTIRFGKPGNAEKHKWVLDVFS